MDDHKQKSSPKSKLKSKPSSDVKKKIMQSGIFSSCSARISQLSQRESTIILPVSKSQCSNCRTVWGLNPQLFS